MPPARPKRSAAAASAAASHAPYKRAHMGIKGRYRVARDDDSNRDSSATLRGTSTLRRLKKKKTSRTTPKTTARPASKPKNKRAKPATIPSANRSQRSETRGTSAEPIMINSDSEREETPEPYYGQHDGLSFGITRNYYSTDFSTAHHNTRYFLSRDPDDRHFASDDDDGTVTGDEFENTDNDNDIPFHRQMLDGDFDLESDLRGWTPERDPSQSSATSLGDRQENAIDLTADEEDSDDSDGDIPRMSGALQSGPSGFQFNH